MDVDGLIQGGACSAAAWARNCEARWLDFALRSLNQARDDESAVQTLTRLEVFSSVLLVMRQRFPDRAQMFEPDPNCLCRGTTIGVGRAEECEVPIDSPHECSCGEQFQREVGRTRAYWKCACGRVRADRDGMLVTPDSQHKCPGCSPGYLMRVQRSGSVHWKCTEFPECTYQTDAPVKKTRSLKLVI